MNTSNQTPVLVQITDANGDYALDHPKYSITFEDRHCDAVITQKATGLSFTMYRHGIFKSLLKNTQSDFGAIFHRDESSSKADFNPLHFPIGTVFTVNLNDRLTNTSNVSGIPLKATSVSNNTSDPENCLIEYEFVNEQDKQMFRDKENNFVNSSHIDKIISLGSGECLLDEEKKFNPEFPKHVFMKKKQEFEDFTGVRLPISATKRHRFIFSSNMEAVLRNHNRRIKIQEAIADLTAKSIIVKVVGEMKDGYDNTIDLRNYYRIDMPRYKAWLSKNFNKFLEKRIKVQMFDYLWYLQDQIDTDIGFNLDPEDSSYSYMDMQKEQKENRVFFEALRANGKIVHESQYRDELATGKYEHVFGVFKDYYFFGTRTSPVEHLSKKVTDASKKVIEIMVANGVSEEMANHFGIDVICAISSGANIPEVIFKAIAKSKA